MFGIVMIPESYVIPPEAFEAYFEQCPAMRDVDWILTQPDEILATRFSQKNIPYLDLTETLQAYYKTTGRSPYIRTAGHLHADAQRIIGDAIAVWIAGTFFHEDLSIISSSIFDSILAEGQGR
jgi:hypothetical protein